MPLTTPVRRLRLSILLSSHPGFLLSLSDTFVCVPLTTSRPHTSLLPPVGPRRRSSALHFGDSRQVAAVQTADVAYVNEFRRGGR